MSEVVIQNVQNEILFVGSLYKKSDLFVEYGRFIKSKYDLSDEVTKFFYDNFEVYYKTFSQTLDESKLNTYMSQNKERMKDYRRYGGYKTIKQWMDLADAEDFKNYMEIVKKYSLLREFNNKGYNVSIIMEHKKFNTLKANDIYRIIRSRADKIGTIILSNEESAVINENTVNTLNSFLISPQMGLTIPFPTLNESFRGFRQSKMFAVGMLSNEGKSRLAISMACYIALIEGENVLFLANEMSELDFRSCVLTTIINSKEYQELHGVTIRKPEREIVLGIYKDDNGNLLERHTDAEGNFIEDESDYINRVYNNSTAYRNVIKIADWMENETKNKIFFKKLTDYSDESLEFEIRKHKMVSQTEYVFYDTMKCYKEENWAVLKQTTTRLNDLALSLDVFIWASIQLTDDSVYTDIFGFSSNNIGASKGLKHTLDFLCLCKRLNKEEYHRYRYVPTTDEWGEQREVALNLDKTYYGIKIDKSRSGGKDKIPLIEVDLDTNKWVEVGYLIKAPKGSKGD